MPKSILKHSKSVVDIKPPKSILKMSQSLTNIKKPCKKVSFVDSHTPDFKQQLMHECDRLLEMIDGSLHEGEEAWYWENNVEKGFPQYWTARKDFKLMVNKFHQLTFNDSFPINKVQQLFLQNFHNLFS